jgi:threonine synthase
VQEWQLTTYGGNIHSLEVMGDFDVCQKLVKQAFADSDLRDELFITSANSINVARWLPQQMYFFLALQQWTDKNPPVICVPSGNFGNICAGLMAWAGGLPVQHFLAACNANDVVPRFMQTGKYNPYTAVATLSNAMDVGDPSNFVRVLEIFGQSFPELQSMLSSVSISDEVTTSTISGVWEKYGYLLDPHGAVAYAALEEYLANHPGQKGILLETAHPVKFPESVEGVTGQKIPLPDQVKVLEKKERRATLIPAEYAEIKQYLLDQFR